MADVNEYFLDRFEENQSDDNDDFSERSNIEDKRKEFEKKLRRHRLSNIYRISIGLIIVLILLGSAYYNYQKQIYSDYDISKEITYSEAPSAHYLEFNGNILRYSQDGASAFNIDNDMIWNVTFEMQNPIADSCKDYVALGDYMGTTIYIFNSEGLKGTIDTSTPLRNFCVSGTGSVAVVMEEEEVTWIKLFDVNGVNVASDKTTMARSGYPVRVDISDDGILLSVSHLFVDSGVLSTKVAFYNFGAVGQNEIDNLVSGFEYTNTIVSEVCFMNADTTYAVGDDRFVIYKGAQKPESTYEKLISENILSVFNNNQYVGLVFDDSNGENKYRVEVYNDEGTLVCSQGFDTDYTDIAFYKDLVIVYGAEECEIYNMSGLKKYSGSFEKSAIIVLPESKSKYLIVSGDGMEEIKLK